MHTSLPYILSSKRYHETATIEDRLVSVERGRERERETDMAGHDEGERERLQAIVMDTLLARPTIPWPPPVGDSVETVSLGKDSFSLALHATVGKSYKDIKREMTSKSSSKFAPWGALAIDSDYKPFLECHRDVVAAVCKALDPDDDDNPLPLPESFMRRLPAASVRDAKGRFIPAPPGSPDRPSPFALISKYCNSFPPPGAPLTLIRQYVELYDKFNTPDRPAIEPIDQSDNELMCIWYLKRLLEHIPGVSIVPSAFINGPTENAATSEFDALIVHTESNTVLLVVEMKRTFPPSDVQKKVRGLHSAAQLPQPFKAHRDPADPVYASLKFPPFPVPLIYVAETAHKNAIADRILVETTRYLRKNPDAISFTKWSDSARSCTDRLCMQPHLLFDIVSCAPLGEKICKIDVSIEIDEDFPFAGILRLPSRYDIGNCILPRPMFPNLYSPDPSSREANVPLSPPLPPPPHNPYTTALLKYHTAAVIEHHLKWRPLLLDDPTTNEKILGSYDFTHVDRMVDYCIKNSLKIKGHVLVWHVTSPVKVLRRLSDSDFADAVKHHIFTVMTRYKDKIKTWDVVNEALAPDGTLARTVFTEKMGSGFIGQCFRWAHEADPTATLLYNDNKV